jgi:hypothetical protein
VRRSEELTFLARAPAGPQRRFQRPALTYDVARYRELAALTVALHLPHLEAAGTSDLLHHGDFTLDAALAFGPVTLLGRWDATHYAFDDWATNGGEDVVKVNLDVRIARWVTGLDVKLGSHVLHARRMSTRLATTSDWADNGNVTARRFFSLDTDFALFLRHVYSASVVQESLGWSWQGERWSAAAGLQHLAAENEPGGIVYGSAVVAALNGHDDVNAGAGQALGVTASVGRVIAGLSVRLALAQLVPLPTAAPVKNVRPTPAPTPDPNVKGSAGAATSASFDGGRLAVIELEKSF